MPQWQYSVAKIEPETQYLTAPQRQPPSMFLMVIDVYVGTKVHITGSKKHIDKERDRVAFFQSACG